MKRSQLLTMMLKYGTMMNFNADDPGGMVGDAGTPSGGDTVDTAENTGVPEGGDDTDASNTAAAGDDTGDDAGKDTSAADTDTDTRFNALSDQITGLVDAVNKNSTNSTDDGEKDNSLEGQDLVAMLADDPDGFVGKLTEAIRESVIADVRNEQANSAYDGEIESTIDTYADSNPDFEKMWDDGKIQDFITENPGHNAISAHMAMTMESRIDAAKKEGAEEATKNYNLKATNQVLDGGIGIPLDQLDAALQNPGKFGGRAAVLASRAGIT